MKFSLLITGSPTSTRACHSALDFALALMRNGDHSLAGVFFYEDATYIANHYAMPPRDECHISQEWADFSAQYETPLYVCIAAAVRRGVINDTEAKRYELKGSSLAKEYQLEGLGTLVSLSNKSDKVVRFR